MRRPPWPVTGSLASSLPSTMTTSEPSPHDELASRPLQQVRACSTFHWRFGKIMASVTMLTERQLASTKERKSSAQCLPPLVLCFFSIPRQLA